MERGSSYPTIHILQRRRGRKGVGRWCTTRPAHIKFRYLRQFPIAAICLRTQVERDRSISCCAILLVEVAHVILRIMGEFIHRKHLIILVPLYLNITRLVFRVDEEGGIYRLISREGCCDLGWEKCCGINCTGCL